MAIQPNQSVVTPKSAVRKSFIAPDDVLMGRGARATENEGNVRFRQVVRSRLREYLTAPRRQEKDQIAREILAIVKSRNGRFLRKVESMDDSQASDYAVVQDDVALLKVKQALRDQKLEEANSVSASSSVSSVENHKGSVADSGAFNSPKASPMLGGSSDALLLETLKTQARMKALENIAFPSLAQPNSVTGLAAARILAERELVNAAALRAAAGTDSILGAALLNQGSILGLNSRPLSLLALETEARMRFAQQATLQDLLAQSAANQRIRAGGFQELGDITSAQRLFKRQKI
mmetsp:Transcript_13881/g.33357  ORF Transcript_13881/g.33357 Transcript_13881/m.33357 type:complete len:293 (-) Transcript_13881:310-1188(-)